MLKREELVALFPLKYLKETKDGERKYRLDPTEKEYFDTTLKKVLLEVFKDFNFRTLRKTDAGNSMKSLIEQHGGPTQFFVNTLKETNTQHGNYFQLVREYFLGNITEPFDCFHYKLCSCFLAAIGQHERKNIYENLRYGKAQKIVNMMFKHLYCMEGAEKYENLFESCHMALDSYTLEWFCRCHKVYGDKGISYQGIVKGKIPEWSNLDYDKHENERDDSYLYSYFVESIKKLLKKEYPNGKTNPYIDYTPFQAEFQIWPDIQLTMATEAYIMTLPDNRFKNENSEKTDKEIEHARRKDLANRNINQLIEKAQELSASFMIKRN